MPELPEVENVKRQLNQKFANKTCKIVGFKFLRSDLRDPIPLEKLRSLLNSDVLRVDRRAKYLLIHTSAGVIISHLGMTGQWRWQSQSLIKNVLTPHDHIVFEFQIAGDFMLLIYRDPRRFGSLDFSTLEGLDSHHRLRHLGPEPLDVTFDAKYLHDRCAKSSVSIKNLVMNQEVVVGVGNIYAVEALFQAKIRPQTPSSKVSMVRCALLVQNIKSILVVAIEKGGSTIKDYRGTESQRGSFQNQHQVYGREGEACRACKSPIRRIVLSGRSSFYCPKCQKG